MRALLIQNLKIRLNWGLFEERSGRFEDAQKIYEAALAVTSLDIPLQKQIALKLLKLYEVQGKRKEHQKRLAWAQSYFKGDLDVKNIQPMRLPASVK